jgi:hypothetical protein
VQDWGGGGLKDGPPGMLWTEARVPGTRTKVHVPDVETKSARKTKSVASMRIKANTSMCLSADWQSGLVGCF